MSCQALIVKLCKLLYFITQLELQFAIAGVQCICLNSSYFCRPLKSGVEKLFKSREDF